MNTKKPSLQQFDPKNILLFLIPLAAYLLPGICLVGFKDAFNILRFALTLIIFAAASFPLTVMLFPLSRSGGYTLGKTLGVLSGGLFVWTLTYLKIGRLNIVFIIISIIVLAFASWYPKNLREEALRFLRKDDSVANIAAEETVFALALVILCFFKGYNCAINGQEKFMDYGFMMSMIRNSKLPANDMWLSGFSINYYYFGQYIYAYLARLSLIKTSVAYTVSMCCAIALPFTMCFSIGTMLIDGARSFGARCGRAVSVICGVLTGLCVMIFGNSHSFFYDENSLGNSLLDKFSSFGINVGRTDHFFYPDSTRFIGYNPDSAILPGINNGGDYTIEEFPFYSYLIGDLHAHVCSTMVVLLIFAIAVNLVSRVYSSELLNEHSINAGADIKTKIMFELKYLLRPEVIFTGILLGICQMTNYWDFLIYFIFGSMLLLVVNTYRTGTFATIPGVMTFAVVMGGILGLYLYAAYMPVVHTLLQLVLFALSVLACAYFPCTLSRTASGMSFFFTAATIVALPFNYNFEMISNKLASCVNHTSAYQIFILWGTHLIICTAFIFFVIVFKRTPSGKTEYNNPIEKFFKERNPIDVLMSGSVIVGILLLAAPEIFYVRDIYTSGYLRSNTMFKFTYAGFILLSVCMAYAVLRLMFMDNQKGEFSNVTFVVSIVFCFMLLVPAHYTYAALKQRCGDLSIENYKTLDGTAYIADYTSSHVDNAAPGNLTDYMNCINWFNEEVEGSPVILEAYGLSYTDYNMVSAYTGLPTVCGWQTHEWLWRFHGIVDKESDLLVADPDHDVWKLYLTPRHADIDIMYTSDDPDTVLSLLRQYNVEYVVLGDLERHKYGGVDNTALFASLGRVAYCSGDLMVIQIWTE